MGKPKILLIGQLDHAQKDWEELSDIAELITADSKDRDEFIKDCGGKYKDVVACFRTFTSVSMTGLIDEDLISHLPQSLKYICHNGAGYDQISVPALDKRGIRLSTTPGAVVDSTADCGLFLIIGAMRNYNKGIKQLRRGEFKSGVPLGHDLQGKTLGILGMGDIGRAMALRMSLLGMKIIYHNRRKLDDLEEKNATYVSFDELLAKSDVLSLNLPLNPRTRHIIDDKEFAKMKDGIVIVNTARGAVMNEAALVKALDAGKVRSAGLDVYEDEPKVHPGLIANENVLLVPHMGTHTYETQKAMELLVINNIRKAVTSGQLITPVN